MVEFMRQLIHNTVSGDVLDLAVYAARARTGATKEEMQTLLDAVQNEHAVHGVWPRGF